MVPRAPLVAGLVAVLFGGIGCGDPHLLDRPHVPDQLVIAWRLPVGARPGMAIGGRRVLRRAPSHFDDFAQQLLADNDLRPLRQMRGGRVWLVESGHARTKRELMQTARLLAGNDSVVEWVAANSLVYFAQGTGAPVDEPRYGEQWALPQIEAAGAWDITTGSRQVVVAVVDTGIELGHLDLACNLWVNACEDTDQDGQITDADDNDADDACPGETEGNGAVDDFHGWSFVDLDDDLADAAPHGTHVSGILGACGHNGIGIAGVSPQVSLAVVRVGHATIADVARVADGIDYAVELGADVINASFTTFDHPYLASAIQKAGAHGTVVVAAAGYGQYGGEDLAVHPTYPAAYSWDNVIAVTSTTEDDGLEPFANFGATVVELGAPGTRILSTIDGGYYLRSGTSMAVPHVTGVVALIRALLPEASVERIRRCLRAGDPVPALAGKTEWGVRLDAAGALETCREAASRDAPAAPVPPTLLGR